MRGWSPVTVGSEPRSDAIGIRRTRLARFIRRLEENTPRPTNGGRFRVSPPHSEREQAIEEEARAYQCLPQILGGGLLAV